MNEPNLVCPYTGVTMDAVFKDDVGKDTGWYFEGGFDPAIPFLSEDMALMAARRRFRNGAGYEVSKLFCPYTGKPLRVTHRAGPNLWHITGEFFSPSTLWNHPDDLLYFASFRGGRKPKFDRVVRESVKVIEDFSDQSNPAEGLGGRSDAVEQGVELLLGG